MPEIIIYGASDDLVEVEGAVCEEYDSYGKTTLIVESADKEESLIVTVEYVGDWELFVGTHSYRDPFPNWTIRFAERPGYESDPAIFIDAPAGTTVRLKE